MKLRIILVVSVLFAETDASCGGWRSCSSSCGGGQHDRTCDSGLFGWGSETQSEACNEFCYNGGYYSYSRCSCHPWRSGSCCEYCSHIYIAHCVAGRQECGGSPDGIRCTECDPPYQPAGFNNGCVRAPCSDRNGLCDQICSTVSGVAQCGCNTGYRLASNGYSCTDIDECVEGTSRCNHNCTNNHGSYVCSCVSGFTLDADRHSCNDIDECKEGTSRCEQNCTNNHGSYVCSCVSGFKLEADNHSCNVEPCTFDPNTQCIWKDAPSGDDFDWTMTSGETPSSGTGPSMDHTMKNNLGKYLFIETSGSRQTGDRAWLVSPLLPPVSHPERCLQFWYNMNGPTIGFLSVFKTRQGEAPGTKIWGMSGDQGPEWKNASVTVASADQYQLIIEAVAGSSYFGDIAIDDITMSPSACKQELNP
ncbi:multiple epidermal growth factor-like domains protein 6 isoform X2 [Dreissena polymorpha]|uniref:multiple epidermal growth factor-like domains protein 6 isoform X2 n=1 Tax=Dreissena polymorpha TaxID=45954 RepID=UPI002265443F|nr:multiple epidermal growth factor-like domains protein 6 isoform X2 [Dreissena polymorpha]